MNKDVKTPSPISPQSLAAMGGGIVAYVKPMRSEEINRLFPDAPKIAPGLDLFALLAADGTPILLADSKDAAIANAWEHDLVTVSVH
jgi:hypothetical protein